MYNSSNVVDFGKLPVTILRLQSKAIEAVLDKRVVSSESSVVNFCSLSSLLAQ